jgi:hypothetical protein
MEKLPPNFEVVRVPEEDAWKDFVWVVQRVSWEDSDILGIFYLEREAVKCAKGDIAREEQQMDSEGRTSWNYEWRVEQYEIS